MGAFHCPIGAIGYDAQGCINCGMCIANTKEERISASELIRNYLKENASLRVDRTIKKIAICGKGGAGKSTVTALLAMAFESFGYKVLVIDADDSNMGLFRKIGTAKQPKQIYNIEVDDEDSWTKIDPLSIAQIPKEYVERNGNISVVEIGKILNPFQGCACSPMQLARNLVLNLDPKDDEIVIADQEAGLESFGRGVEQGCDTILTIVEPSFESIEMANTMQYMAEGFGIQRVRAVVSKVEDEDEAEIIIDELSDRDIRYLGVLKKDKSISKANLMGKNLKETSGLEMVKDLAKLLLDEAEMKIFNNSGG